MNGFIAIVGFLLIRFALVMIINPKALQSLQAYIPMPDSQIYLILYQISNLILVIYPLFMTLSFNLWLDYLGMALYLIGLMVLLLAILNFCQVQGEQILTSGIFAWSRHPMYLAYFLIFLGIGIWDHDIIYLIFLALFQYSAHFIIKAEEAWCLSKFGSAYQEYMDKVGRYFLFF